MFGGCFGIRTPPARQTHAAITEVLACLTAASVYAHRRQGMPWLQVPKYWLVWRLLRYTHAAGRANSCCNYRSIGLFDGCFGIRTLPAGLAMATITEVEMKRANTSVNFGAELLKSRWDYRSGSRMQVYFGKYLSQAREARLRLRKYEQEWR